MSDHPLLVYLFTNLISTGSHTFPNYFGNPPNCAPVVTVLCLIPVKTNPHPPTHPQTVILRLRHSSLDRPITFTTLSQSSQAPKDPRFSRGGYMETKVAKRKVSPGPTTLRGRIPRIIVKKVKSRPLASPLGRDVYAGSTRNSNRDLSRRTLITPLTKRSRRTDRD